MKKAFIISTILLVVFGSCKKKERIPWNNELDKDIVEYEISSNSKIIDNTLLDNIVYYDDSTISFNSLSTLNYQIGDIFISENPHANLPSKGLLKKVKNVTISGNIYTYELEDTYLTEAFDKLIIKKSYPDLKNTTLTLTDTNGMWQSSSASRDEGRYNITLPNDITISPNVTINLGGHFDIDGYFDFNYEWESGLAPESVDLKGRIELLSEINAEVGFTVYVNQNLKTWDFGTLNAPPIQILGLNVTPYIKITGEMEFVAGGSIKASLGAHGIIDFNAHASDDGPENWYFNRNLTFIPYLKEWSPSGPSTNSYFHVGFGVVGGAKLYSEKILHAEVSRERIYRLEYDGSASNCKVNKIDEWNFFAKAGPWEYEHPIVAPSSTTIFDNLCPNYNESKCRVKFWFDAIPNAGNYKLRILIYDINDLVNGNLSNYTREIPINLAFEDGNGVIVYQDYQYTPPYGWSKSNCASYSPPSVSSTMFPQGSYGYIVIDELSKNTLPSYQWLQKARVYGQSGFDVTPADLSPGGCILSSCALTGNGLVWGGEKSLNEYSSGWINP